MRYTTAMSLVVDEEFERTDIWREGKWLDLWSVVHLFSGVSIGLGIFLFHFGAVASTLLVLVSLIAYEMWEILVQIQEMPTNRLMDVFVGMVSFLPTFFFLAPALIGNLRVFILVFVLVFAANAVLSVFGWHASQKAATLEKRIRARYEAERVRLHGRISRSRRRGR